MENNEDVFYMRMALAEAGKAAESDEVPVGAVIVAGKSVIARAHNLTETLNDPTAHAEMQAITAATSFLGSKYLTDCSIYITVEPCVMCAGALAWSQISEIIYGTPDEKKGYTTTGAEILHPGTIVRSGVLAGECADLIKQFFRKKR
jgi:tRNA(adenine34) deaminase